jgi:hypothetical protein
MKNCIAQEVVFLTRGHVVAKLPPAKNPAMAVAKPSTTDFDSVMGVPIEVSDRAPTERIDNLPDEGDILVALAVVSAMRELGTRHHGRVFSPKPLVFDENRKPIGTPGLIRHRDVEETD